MDNIASKPDGREFKKARSDQVCELWWLANC